MQTVYEASVPPNRRVRPSSAVPRARSAAQAKQNSSTTESVTLTIVDSPVVSPIVHTESKYNEHLELGIMEDTDEANESEFDKVLENYYKAKSSPSLSPSPTISPSSESDASPDTSLPTPKKFIERPKSAKLDSYQTMTPKKIPSFLSLSNISKITEYNSSEMNGSIQTVMSEILGNRSFRRPGSADLIRPSSAPPVQQEKVKDAIRQLWNLSTDSIVKTTSRPSTATTRHHRPLSVTSRNESVLIEKTSRNIPTKPLHDINGRKYFDETNLIEKNLYEANCIEKVRLANDFCRGLTLPYRWEFKIAENERNQYRARLYKKDMFIKEVNMELFQRDFDKLRRDRIQAHKEHKSIHPSQAVKESKERHYEKFEIDRKTENKALIHETQSIISALEDQIRTLS